MPGGPPVLHTRMSTGPSAPSTSATTPSIASRSALSRTKPVAPISAAAASIFSRERELIATRAPSRASSAAIARPMPCDAPVTSATLPPIPRSMRAEAIPRGRAARARARAARTTARTARPRSRRRASARRRRPRAGSAAPRAPRRPATRAAGNRTTRAVTSAHSSHAPGPASQPQSSKKLWGSARASATESTATDTACTAAARQSTDRSMPRLWLTRAATGPDARRARRCAGPAVASFVSAATTG